MMRNLLIRIRLTRPLGHSPIERILQTLQSCLEGIESIPIIRVRDDFARSIDVVEMVYMAVMGVHMVRMLMDWSWSDDGVDCV